MNTRAAWIGGTALAVTLAFGITWGVLTLGSPATAEPPTPADSTPVVVEQVAFDPPDLTGPPRSVGQWPWLELRGGECLGSVPGQTVIVDVVSCDDPHPAKYLRPVLESADPDESYPGPVSLEASAGEHCSGLSASELGITEEVADLVVVGLYSPDEDSWKAGHRVTSCVVYRLDGGDLPAVQPDEQ